MPVAGDRPIGDGVAVSVGSGGASDREVGVAPVVDVHHRAVAGDEFGIVHRAGATDFGAPWKDQTSIADDQRVAIRLRSNGDWITTSREFVEDGEGTGDGERIVIRPDILADAIGDVATGSVVRLVGAIADRHAVIRRADPDAHVVGMNRWVGAVAGGGRDVHGVIAVDAGTDAELAGGVLAERSQAREVDRIATAGLADIPTALAGPGGRLGVGSEDIHGAAAFHR